MKGTRGCADRSIVEKPNSTRQLLYERFELGQYEVIVNHFLSPEYKYHKIEGTSQQ